ncbi:DMT family transporter [Pseudomonas saudiphocaensis]|uniref:DMT family transporter n=1 Tax=Pseudomonas saudiphocaensis TaxID=1499686 RepID=UPI000F775B16|nr:DMT family transporter [Pseudomonas saudiphocaensis]RRV18078.1 EamA family transporter [Pseudomonas saudiphocaensis]
MTARTLLLIALAMLAFAGNSLLCRVALRDTGIDPASFTALRLLAGAIILWLLLRLRRAPSKPSGSWAGAFALFLYAAAFSWAYVKLDAGAGALLLFAAVQLSMIAWGIFKGERLSPLQALGSALALVGLISLLLPDANAPAFAAALLMIISGVAWGAYSLLGRGIGDPLAATAGNFIRAVPMGAALCLLTLPAQGWDQDGVLLALLSGGLTSGVGYALWYAVVPRLASTQAASIQLSVPLLTVLAGSMWLGEALTSRLLISGLAILGGIVLVFWTRSRT